MRHSPVTMGNAVAAIVLIILAGAAGAAVIHLGPAGLLLPGLLILFLCSRISMDDAAPGWGTHVFRARMADPGSPEQRAAGLAARQAALGPIRFFQWCGVGLALMGALGFAWQQWH